MVQVVETESGWGLPSARGRVGGEVQGGISVLQDERALEVMVVMVAKQCEPA